MACTQRLEDKIKVLQLHSKGLPYTVIAEQTPCSVSRVRRIVRNWKEKKTVERKPGSGRPRKATQQIVQDAIELFEAHPRKTLQEAHEELSKKSNPLDDITTSSRLNISAHTFGNAVRDAGYGSYLAHKEEELTATNKTR